MALTEEQKIFIRFMHDEATRILRDGNKEELLKSLFVKMEKLHEIIAVSNKDELNHYLKKYNGFYLYMKMLEELAGACSQGVFDDVLKQDNE